MKSLGILIIEEGSIDWKLVNDLDPYKIGDTYEVKLEIKKEEE